MKMKNKIQYIIAAILAIGCLSCNDLTEKVYDQIVTENYYNTKDDVIRAYVRPLEHAFWSIGANFGMQEQPADQLGTWNREGDWLDGGNYQRWHYHKWSSLDGFTRDGWNANFQGITQINAVLDDFVTLDPAKFGMTQAELDEFSSGLRTMRAWFYINLLDQYRNIPLAISRNQELNSKGQVSPQEVFDFIETELKAVIPMLPVKQGTGGNQLKQGIWNQAGAASLLVKLYLNAEKWIGTAMYSECAVYAQDIIDGKYGTYRVADRWDEPFDWNNETSDEVIYAFTASKSRARWHMNTDMYWWSLPANAHFFFGFMEFGGMNPKYALQPSRDLMGNLYNFELGMPVGKFQKYPEDYRLKKYRNLPGTSQREGMFLYGYLEYTESGQTKRVQSPKGYDYYIRDQVGPFKNAAPSVTLPGVKSEMANADHNSGWHPVKYPVYRDGDPGAIESDFALIRLPEIYYSLAECKFRAGDVEEAGRLLNVVRKRNYPSEYHNDYLYKPEGVVELTQAELLDEWGREFLAEGRRRTDLIRWNKFTTGTWWDKEPDAGNHWEIYPIHYEVLGANPDLVQNPGYDN